MMRFRSWATAVWLVTTATVGWADGPADALLGPPPVPPDPNTLTQPIAPVPDPALAQPWRPGAIAGQPPVMPAPAAPLGMPSPYAVPPAWGSAGVVQGTRGAGPAAGYGPYWAPGGYEARIGSPYHHHDPNGGQFVVTGNPYYDHFGPGFHRESLHGHYRFPYYNYRAPWYYPGRAVYNRDTNFPW